MNVRFTREEIESVFAPYVEERFAPGDARWAAMVERTARKQKRLRDRVESTGIEPGANGQESVRELYSTYWRTTSATDLIKRKATPYEWRGEGLLAQAVGRKRLHEYMVWRVLRDLRPARALEVGSGNGFNLFVLATRLEGCRFVGAELTYSGADAAERLRSTGRLPDALMEFASEPVQDRHPQDRLRFVQATAAALPFADRAFDVTFTVLALEQMSAVRSAALKELARVTRSYVLMIEPFQDWNADGLQRDYVVAHGYFDAAIADLASCGLEPVAVESDIPNKLTFRVGLVVARPLRVS
jgi:SAM-dependent methyltransferase